MDFTEIKTKSESELTKLLREKREELREVRFRVRRGEEKDVRRVRELKLEIAQILTALR